MHSAFLLAKTRHITLLANKLFTTKRYTFSIALSNIKYITQMEITIYILDWLCMNNQCRWTMHECLVTESKKHHLTFLCAD